MMTGDDRRTAMAVAKPGRHRASLRRSPAAREGRTGQAASAGEKSWPWWATGSTTRRPGPGRRRHCDRHGNRCRHRGLGYHARPRRPPRRCLGHRPVAGDDPHDPAELVLGLCLQHRRHPDRHRGVLSMAGLAALAHSCQRGDELLQRIGRRQQPPPAEIPAAGRRPRGGKLTATSSGRGENTDSIGNSPIGQVNAPGGCPHSAPTYAAYGGNRPDLRFSTPRSTNHQPPTTNHQPPTTNTNHQPPTTNHQPPTTNHQPPTTNHQPPTSAPLRR